MRIIIPVVLMVYVSVSYGEIVDKVVTVVNNEIIKLSELNAVANPYIYLNKDKLNKPSDIQEVKKKILDEMIKEKLLQQEAQAQNIEVSNTEVESSLEMSKSKFNSEDEFKNALKEEGLTILQYKEKIKRNFQMQKLINDKIKKELKVNLCDIQDFYEKNTKELKGKDKYKIRHILFKITNTIPEEKVLGKAEAVLKLIKDGGDFAGLAKAYSENLSNKDNGGLIGESGYVEKGDLDADLEKAVLSLKEGEVSGLVKTPMAIHIIKLEKKEEGKLYHLSDEISFNNEKISVREYIKNILLQQQFNAKLDDFLNKLKLKSVIEIKLEEVVQ